MRAVLLILALLLAGCRAAAPDRQPLPQQGMWDGAVQLPDDGISVRLQMSLDLSASQPSGYFLVGDEKTPIPEISRSGDDLTLRFSEYGAEVRASWNGRELDGNYLRIRSDGTKSFKFTAQPRTATPETAASASSPAGAFQVSFQNEEKPDDTTVAKFWSEGGVLRGTFIAPDGDYGLLTGGPAKDGGFQFNRFTGWQSIAIALKPSGDSWSGKFYAASNPKPREFVLKPGTDLASAGGAKVAAMKTPNAPFTFSGISLTGETVTDADARFKGKAVIVDIMGTWCHNCLDEAPILQRLQEQYGKDGLEIVGLSFEISDDPALAKKNLQLFKERFGLTYTLLFCGSLDDDNVQKQLHSQLDNFFAYPTSLFIDRNRKVQFIHSGFKGPGTGDEFQNQIREFDMLAARLVGK